MTAKAFVKSNYPKAKSEKYNYSHRPGSYVIIWDGTEKIGTGENALEAWQEARRNILKVKAIKN